MLKRTLLVLLLSSTTALPQTPTEWTPELSMQVDAIGEVVPSPDGQWVAYTHSRSVIEEKRSEFLTQIYLARADGSRRYRTDSLGGHKSRVLTSSRARVPVPVRIAPPSRVCHV